MWLDVIQVTACYDMLVCRTWYVLLVVAASITGDNIWWSSGYYSADEQLLMKCLQKQLFW